MIKKIISFLLIFILIISLTACGKPDNYYDCYNKENKNDSFYNISLIEGISFYIMFF